MNGISMKISELIEQLEEFQDEHGPDIEVMMTADYGDRGHTRQALRISDLEVSDLYKTAYSDSGLAVKKDEEDEDDETAAKVVTLNS